MIYAICGNKDEACNNGGENMRVAILSSGSKGNAIYIETPQSKVLIDAGLSAKAISERLLDVGTYPEELSAVFVTHEHLDHIKGVGVLGRKFSLPVFATQKTWECMETKVGLLNEGQKCTIKKQGFLFNDMQFVAFPVSHDAVDPIGFAIVNNGKKLGIATDSGVITPPMKDFLQGSHGLILECNHDKELLERSHYPFPLKQRIKSRIGHLSNEETIQALPYLIDSHVEKLILGHLSEDNNRPNLVREMALDALTRIKKLQELHIDVHNGYLDVVEQSGDIVHFYL